jgi:hypothetical protein
MFDYDYGSLKKMIIDLSMFIAGEPFQGLLQKIAGMFSD